MRCRSALALAAIGCRVLDRFCPAPSNRRRGSAHLGQHGITPAEGTTVARTTETPDTLNDRMEFDHVIRVHEDGTVSDAGIPAPDLDGESDTVSAPWQLMTGYTGQHGYRGPIMHQSEFIGGRMARDILATPGLYVALVAETYPDDPDAERELIGWAVAYQHDGATS